MYDKESQKQDSTALHERFDHIVWMGDFNYRIEGTKSLVQHLLKEGPFEVLLANDQLVKARLKDSFPTYYREGDIEFPPTYKLTTNSN